MPPEINSYLEGIMLDANIKTADEETKDEMLKELFARFDNFMTSSIVENLKEEDMDEFIKMGAEKKPREEIEKFITDKIPDATEVFSQAMMEFRDLYLGSVAVARNTPEQDSPTLDPSSASPVKSEAN